MAYLERESGGRVYYEDHGSGSSAIVLVHGWGMSLRAWDYSLPALVEGGYRVVALDHRGCGASDKDFADLGITAIAGDVVALVDALRLERVVLNGWSLGGAVVVAAASQLAQRCAGLVLTCGATPVYLQKSDFPHGGTDQALADTLAAMSADRVNFLMALSRGVCACAVSEEIVSWMWQMFMQASPLAARSLAELGPLDQRAMLASLSMPILSIVGGKDAIVDPQICRSVGTFNAGVRTVEFENAGHAPFIEEAQRYNAELLNFLAECL
jgi:pimeloyl-ACP methyl ester carboxylesterase